MTGDQVAFAAYLVGRMILKGDAIGMLQEKYQLTEDESRQLYRAGRRSLRRWVDAPAERHHLESAAFYRSVVQDPQAETQDQLKARIQLDKVMGVETRPSAREDKELNQAEVIRAVERILERYQEAPSQPVHDGP